MVEKFLGFAQKRFPKIIKVFDVRKTVIIGFNRDDAALPL